MHLLLIEDDPAMQLSLQRSLERAGMHVSLCSDGLQALPTWQAQQPDVVALDLSLPGQDGLQVLQQARKAGLGTPVLILTARGTVGDKVLGLNAGADDYLAKPFDLHELEARLRALHRRQTQLPANHSPTHAQESVLGRLRLDHSSGAAYLGQQVLELPPRELLMLQALMSRPGQAVAKEKLVETVFANDPSVQSEAIEVVAYRLRKRLADWGAQTTGVELVTLRGLGYLLRTNQATRSPAP
ncbi:response regulator transcription factor [Curvibacter sp. CHRR-16]|nr:response regulator transcription factor [Curvibacter sp. CHRR-16]